MKKTISILVGLFLLLSLGALCAQETKAEKAKAPQQDRISGTIKIISADTSTITVRTRSNVDRQIVYNSDTKITQGKTAAKVEDLKEGVRVIALGKFDEKSRLVAQRIDIRQ